MSSVKRIVVWVKSSSNNVLRSANFCESMVNVICGNNTSNSALVYASLQGDKMVISDSPSPEANQRCKLTRPSFCPIRNLQEDQKAQLPDEIKNRGIDCGVVVVLETSDGKVLLTKRANHLHAFPGIWVPPGGHIDAGETLLQTALRELQEETGLKLKEDWCENKNIKILALWESVYPPKLAAGLPKRHHLVVYVYAKLMDPYTSHKLQESLRLDPGEVGASAWIDRQIAEAIVLSMEEEDSGDVRALKEKLKKTLPQTLSVTLVSPSEPEPKAGSINPSVFLNVAPPEATDCERVSTGTKYALSEWLKLPR